MIYSMYAIHYTVNILLVRVTYSDVKLVLYKIS